jgi:hypothetical protein
MPDPMMIRDLVERLVAHRDELAADIDGKAFEASVARFTERLAMIRDCPAADVPQATFDQVSGLADQVIEAIEQRLNDGNDGASLKRRLANTVYAIRGEIEELFRWRKHFGGM